jgi:hypothetical protein
MKLWVAEHESSKTVLSDLGKAALLKTITACERASPSQTASHWIVWQVNFTVSASTIRDFFRTGASYRDVPPVGGTVSRLEFLNGQPVKKDNTIRPNIVYRTLRDLKNVESRRRRKRGDPDE